MVPDSRDVLGLAFPTLLERSRAGDEVAFAEIWRSVNPALVRYLRVLTKRGAEDAASETWLEVVKHWAAFEGDERALRSWIFTIARRKVIDAWRKDKRRPAELVEHADLESLQDHEPSAEELASERFSTEAALALIAQLPKEQAEVVMLRVVVGLETAEIAELVGASVGALRVRQHRALKTLRMLLEAADPALAAADPGGRELAISDAAAAAVTQAVTP